MAAPSSSTSTAAPAATPIQAAFQRDTEIIKKQTEALKVLKADKERQQALLKRIETVARPLLTTAATNGTLSSADLAEQVTTLLTELQRLRTENTRLSAEITAIGAAINDPARLQAIQEAEALLTPPAAKKT